MKKKFRKVRHLTIKLIFLLMWCGIAYQAVVYFINPVRVESYKLAVDYWHGMWKVFFG